MPKPASSRPSWQKSKELADWLLADDIEFGDSTHIEAAQYLADDIRARASLECVTFYHGDFVLATAASGFILPTGWSYGIGDSLGTISSSQATFAHWPPALKKGDRAKSLSLLANGDDSADLFINVLHRSSTGTVINTYSTTFASLSSTIAIRTFNFTDITIGADQSIAFGIATGGAGITVYSAQLTYDHPAP